MNKDNTHQHTARSGVLRIRILLLLRPFKCGAGDAVGKVLYSIIVLFIACYAGLGLGQPEVKPSTSGPLPVRLKELTGKLVWMKWEPPPLIGEGGGHKRSGKQAR